MRQVLCRPLYLLGPFTPLRLQDTLQYEDLHTKFASLASRKSTGENECACGKICSTELKSAQCPIRLRDLHYQGLSSCTKTSPALRPSSTHKQVHPLVLYEVKHNLHGDFPDFQQFAELCVQVSYTMDKYKITELIGCITDGSMFHYYKFLDKGNFLMKLMWTYTFFYGDMPSSESICGHLYNCISLPLISSTEMHDDIRF